MSALGRGLLSGLAGGLQGVEKFKEAETDYNRQMTLEEFRAAKEMEREKFRQSFEREQKGLDRAIETAKMGVEQANSIEERKLKKQYYNMMEKYYASQGGGTFTEGQIKRFSIGAANSVLKKYNLRDIAGDSDTPMDVAKLLNRLYSFSGGAETPEMRSNIEAAIAELEQISEALATNPAALGTLLFEEDFQDPRDPAGVRALISGGQAATTAESPSTATAAPARSNFADTPLSPLDPLPQRFDPNDPKYAAPSGGGIQRGLFDAIETVFGHTGRRRI